MTTTDAAWEALYDNLRFWFADDDLGETLADIIACHRPLIEAALLGDADAIGHNHVGEWCALCMKHGHDYAALTPPPAEPTLDVERLARAMDAADVDVFDRDDDPETHAEHLAYARDIAREYARLATEDKP